MELGKVIPRNVLAGADNIRRRGQQRNGFEIVIVERNATIEITGNGALVNGEQGAAIRLGLGRFLGALVAALAGNHDQFDLRFNIHLLNHFFKDRKDHLGAATGFPRHDQLSSGTFGRLTSRLGDTWGVCRNHGKDACVHGQTAQ